MSHLVLNPLWTEQGSQFKADWTQDCRLTQRARTKTLLLWNKKNKNKKLPWKQMGNTNKWSKKKKTQKKTDSGKHRKHIYKHAMILSLEMFLSCSKNISSTQFWPITSFETYPCENNILPGGVCVCLCTRFLLKPAFFIAQVQKWEEISWCLAEFNQTLV